MYHYIDIWMSLIEEITGEVKEAIAKRKML